MSSPGAPTSLAVAVGLLFAASVVPGIAQGREYLGRGIAREGDRLIVSDPEGEVTVDLTGALPLPDPPRGLIVLRRERAAGSQLQVLDRRGGSLGAIDVPRGWTGFATQAGIVLVPESLHEPGRAHWLKFLSHGGEARAEVQEGLTLIGWAVAPGGGVATVSRAPGDGTAWVILAYDGNGAEIWRHEVTGVASPDALLTAGGELVVLERDPAAGAATVTILARGHDPESFRLRSVNRIAADPDSSRVAAVGQEAVALFDARSRKLLWQRDAPIDFVLWGGIRFDRRGARLLVVTAKRDRQAGKARLDLRTYRGIDGAERRATLGEAPVDELPTVVDVETPPEGGQRVLLHDRAMTAVPERTP